MAKRFSFSPNLLWPIIVLIIAFGAFYLKPWQAKPPETIAVTAQGKVQAIPNIAQISAMVESKNPNLETARKENEERVAKLILRLKELGIDEKDIKTQSVFAGPTFEMQFPPPKPTTNQFSTSLEITVRNFENTAEVIATLTQNGATNLYGPNLTIDDQTLETIKSQAREDAVKTAHRKGEELAKLSGRKLGKVTSIKEQGDFILPPPIFAQGAIEVEQKASQIQPGQNEVSITLQVDFELK